MIAIFHSSEFDVRPAEGWYVCDVLDDGPVSDGAIGPFATESDAVAAMTSGDYLYR